MTVLGHRSLMLYRTMQPEYKPAEYLSVVKCASNRSFALRLTSRFRTGCHGLRVDTAVPAGRWADSVHLDRTDRLCLVCKSFDCVGGRAALCVLLPNVQPHQLTCKSKPLDLLQHCCTIADIMTLREPNTCGDFLRNALHVGSKSCLYAYELS